MKNIKFKKLRALMAILLAVGLAVSVYARNKFAGEILPCENPVSDTRYTDNSPDKNREENRAGNISAVWINYYEFGELIKNKNKEEYTAAVEETVGAVCSVDGSSPDGAPVCIGSCPVRQAHISTESKSRTARAKKRTFLRFMISSPRFPRDCIVNYVVLCYCKRRSISAATDGTVLPAALCALGLPASMA